MTFDPSGSVVPGVVLQLTNSPTGESEFATSDGDGRFSFLLLSPGSYDLQASKAGFALLNSAGIKISVTETHRIEVHLQLATIFGQIQVPSEPAMVQTDNSALGRLVDTTALDNLPLVTRNIAQILQEVHPWWHFSGLGADVVDSRTALAAGETKKGGSRA